ncbi:Type 1 glutamine amidotransferase-like domain-containing protein [Lacibacterium aquatile]|uniref:Type 1 glutamine amidotransferase-like domain-containing protein n=1 Tax=Lacibacterium aquatile TaxID=1168082 RepID=A0ABW5DNY7_9PROT
MINLALYSDQIIPANAVIDQRLLALMAHKNLGNRIGYIPSGPEPTRQFFHERKAYYARYDLDLCHFHETDEGENGAAIDALFACDAIHLAGGHTRGYLERLKSNDLAAPLRSWALEGGLLIGTSAGAILMTPTIATDALFSNNRPEDVRDGDALDLLPFEFFPHLNANSSYREELVRYSRITQRPIIACNDGDGLVVTDGVVETIGAAVWIGAGTSRDLAPGPIMKV